MLGSAFAGERATAPALMATMAAPNKLTLNELIALAYEPASSACSGQNLPPPIF